MNRRLKELAAGMALAFVASAVPACAQAPPPGTGETQKQLEALRSQVNAMQKDLDEIKEVLAPLLQRRAPLPAPIDLGRRPMKGSPSASVTLVELTDYQ